MRRASFTSECPRSACRPIVEASIPTALRGGYRGGHAQTLWGKFFRPRPPLPTASSDGTTPDGDFVDIHRLDATAGRAATLLSPRTRRNHPFALRRRLLRRGGATRVGGRSPDFSRLRRRAESRAALLSLGRDRRSRVRARSRAARASRLADRCWPACRSAATCCSSSSANAAAAVADRIVGGRDDLGAVRPRARRAIHLDTDSRESTTGISSGRCGRKALAKLERYPGSVRRVRSSSAPTSIYEFDDAVTAPVHGFADAHDYYSRSSSLGLLDRIARPTLLLSAIDDPFLPPIGARRSSSDRGREIRCLELEFTEHGGHVGFVGGRVPWRPFYYAEWRVCEFLATTL